MSSDFTAPESENYVVMDTSSPSAITNSKLDLINKQASLYAEGDTMPTPNENVLTVGPPTNNQDGGYLNEFRIMINNKGFRVKAYNLKEAISKVYKNRNNNKEYLISVDGILFKAKNNKITKLYK